MRFNKSFTKQEPIPEKGIDRAIELMRSGALHRYSVEQGETSETALLEVEFAKYLGQKYVLACTSGGYALHVALRAAGLKQGDKVLCNAYTLAPVPGAIHNAGGVPLLVDTDTDFTIDLEDLAAKAADDNAKFLMLSHMRGHIADMDKVIEICQANNVCLIEDAAHTMGATWRGKKSGTFGAIGCFSAQTYKHINSGEGGFMCTDDEEIMAKAIIYSGSYMLYDRHLASPDKSAFEKIRFDTPNYSGRMDNLRAAMLRPQLEMLDMNCERWSSRYFKIEKGLSDIDGLVIAKRHKEEKFVGSSIQFRLPDFSAAELIKFIELNATDGIPIKWFGDPEPIGYTSRFDSWRYLQNIPTLAKTQEILATTCDVRIPLTFGLEDCGLIAEIIKDNYHKIKV